MEKISRPWGYYSVLFSSRNYQVKLLSINPGESLSLQYHEHRKEEWIVMHGRGLIQIGDLLEEARMGLHLSIPERVEHQATVSSEYQEPLIVCEVQLGFPLIEEDIVRLEDQYGRT